MAEATVDIASVLELHGKWLRSEEGGKRASPYRANLRNTNLWGANLQGANLRYAILCGTYLSGANLLGAILNWHSHTLLSEILRRSAGDSVERRMLAGLIAVSTDWCWDKFLSLEHLEKAWAINELSKWVQPGDGAPDVIRAAARAAGGASVQCKCGSRAINDDPDKMFCDCCWRDAEIERLQKALKSADGQNASLWKNLFDTEAEISRLKEERTRLRNLVTGQTEFANAQRDRIEQLKSDLANKEAEVKKLKKLEREVEWLKENNETYQHQVLENKKLRKEVDAWRRTFPIMHVREGAVFACMKLPEDER